MLSHHGIHFKNQRPPGWKDITGFQKELGAQGAGEGTRYITGKLCPCPGNIKNCRAAALWRGSKLCTTGNAWPQPLWAEGSFSDSSLGYFHLLGNPGAALGAKAAAPPQASPAAGSYCQEFGLLYSSPRTEATRSTMRDAHTTPTAKPFSAPLAGLRGFSVNKDQCWCSSPQTCSATFKPGPGFALGHFLCEDKEEMG